MDAHNNDSGVNGGLRALFGECLLAWTCISGFVAVWLSNGSKIVAGFLLLIGAVLAMNSLAKLDLITQRTTRRLREHAWIRAAGHITNEGEFAGILVGVITLMMLLIAGEKVHIPYAEALTLFGIMSAANLAVRHMVPVMGLLEKIGGPWLVIAGGSMLASLTGEPAAAVFLTEYLKNRVADKDRAQAATGLGATIGSAGGPMPFAAPPVLIIWATLSTTFGWTITDLMFDVGVGCVLHVGVVTFKVKKLITPAQNERLPFEKKGFWPLALLTGLVASHIMAMYLPVIAPIVYSLDAVVGIANIVLARRRFKNCGEQLREEAFRVTWQPLILSVLLVALEIIGTAADPAIFWVAGFIPADMPVLGVGAVLFLATALTSHFADNALASRVYITVAVAMQSTLGPEVGDFLASCVVQAALFGGFVLIPANLPNFVIARIFRVSAGEWARVGWKLYWTVVPSYAAWIIILWQLRL